VGRFSATAPALERPAERFDLRGLGVTLGDPRYQSDREAHDRHYHRCRYDHAPRKGFILTAWPLVQGSYGLVVSILLQ
jgi:hypothetical protein